MPLKPLRLTFAAGALAATTALGPLTGNAVAQERVETTPASFTTTASSAIPFYEDAEREAIEWLRENDGIAVPVWFGTQSRATPDEIVGVISNTLTNAGANNFEFFFEQNDVRATGLVYSYPKGVSEIHTLDTAIPGAIEAVQDHQYREARPEIYADIGG